MAASSRPARWSIPIFSGPCAEAVGVSDVTFSSHREDQDSGKRLQEASLSVL